MLAPTSAPDLVRTWSSSVPGPVRTRTTLGRASNSSVRVTTSVVVASTARATAASVVGG